jgi:hypothetical protein
MSNEVTLYDFRDESIHINVVARFEKEKLIIDGYDIGKKVQEIMGDSDYEYIITVHEAEVVKLFEVVAIPVGDQDSMLRWLTESFNTNSCFSAFSEFLSAKGIVHETFTWR